MKTNEQAEKYAVELEIKMIRESKLTPEKIRQEKERRDVDEARKREKFAEALANVIVNF